ncbi:hypothetical protein J6590_059280 [Homalodisca vitripennis]|nr:hypothetical protein J6590_059280 [Homalodisca vitripennis]
MTQRCLGQCLDTDESTRHFSKAKIDQQKTMITVWWSAAGVIHYNLWNLAKPSQQSFIVRKLMDCTENCVSSSRHWTTEEF